MKTAHPASLAILAAAAVLLPAGDGTAQERRAAAIETSAGWAAFADESLIHHTALGLGLRVPLTVRISAGPELAWMIGPRSDRDLFLLGNVYFDFRRPAGGRPPVVTPFVVAGAGLFQHRNRFGRDLATHSSLGIAAGGGVRVTVTDHVYVAPDVRLGGEDPHLRATVTIGIRIGG